MTQRITDKMVQARIDTANHLLGFESEVGYNTEGALRIEKAYGGTAVSRMSGEFGGVSMLTGYGTKREAYNYLSGVIEGLRMAAEVKA